MSRRMLIVLALFSVAGYAFAAPPDGAAPASRALFLRLRWEGALPSPGGVLTVCRARVVPTVRGGVGLGGGAMGNSVAVPGGGECALEIPLAWQGSATPAGVEVVYEMEAMSADGRVVRRAGYFTTAMQAAGDGALRISIRK